MSDFWNEFGEDVESDQFPLMGGGLVRGNTATGTAAPLGFGDGNSQQQWTSRVDEKKKATQDGQGQWRLAGKPISQQRAYFIATDRGDGRGRIDARATPQERGEKPASLTPGLDALHAGTATPNLNAMPVANPLRPPPMITDPHPGEVKTGFTDKGEATNSATIYNPKYGYASNITGQNYADRLRKSLGQLGYTGS